MKNNYEKVWDALVEYGVIDETKIYDEKSLLKEIEKKDTSGKIHYSLYEELLNTRRFREVIQQNLKVKEMKTKDIVQDGERFEIPKTRKITYYRKGKKIEYYLAQRRKWNREELEWMQKNRTLPTKLMLYKYYQNFGENRTVSSIISKRRKIGTYTKEKQKRRTLTKKMTEIEEENKL